jgi:peptide/nickel transport system substrate-binding protein
LGIGCQPAPAAAPPARESAPAAQPQSQQAAPAAPAAPAQQSAAAPAAQKQPKQGGTLNVAINKDMVLMNPLIATKSIDEQVRSVMFEPLLGIDLQGKIQPYLAESWDVSPDGKTYTFKLRKGVKFHDGTEMTAEDVKFVIDYTLEPKNGAYGYTLLSMVEGAQVVDPYTLKVQLKFVSPAFLSNIAWIKAFSVVPKGSIEPGVDKPASFPPGTGPFKFSQWLPGQQITLERHADYWGHKALVDKVVMKPVKDDSVRFTALRSGDVDIVQTAPMEWSRQVLDGKVPNVRVVEAPYADFRRLEFNVTSAPFDNRALRLAVAYAVDKKEILSAAFYGFGTPGDQKYPNGHFWYVEGIPSETLDLDKARAYLREAGYSGQPLSIMVEQGVATEAQASTLQAQLRRVGVDAKIDLIEYGTYTDRTRKGEFAFKFSGGSYDADPSTTYAPDFSCGDPTKRSGNSTGYCNQNVDAIFSKAERELNLDLRRQMFKEVLTTLRLDAPDLNVGFVPDFFALRDQVQGFTTDGEANMGWWGGGLHYAWLDK